MRSPNQLAQIEKVIWISNEMLQVNKKRSSVAITQLQDQARKYFSVKQLSLWNDVLWKVHLLLTLFTFQKKLNTAFPEELWDLESFCLGLFVF